MASTPRPVGLGTACLRLGAAIAAAAAPAALVEWLRVGRTGALAVAIAAGLCGAGGAAALAAVKRLRGPRKALLAVAISALVRGVAPLAAGFALRARSPWLAEAGIELWVLAFYLFTLFVEIWLLPGLLAEAPQGRAERS